MTAFDKEGKRLDALMDKYKSFFNTLDERRAKREDDRLSPDRAYRTERMRAEQGVENLRGIKDPAEALKAADELLKTIDRMMNKGEAAGFGQRAGRTADDIEAQINAIMKERGIDINKAKTDNANNIDNAIAKFKADMADNPVAQAALAQAMVVMKEAVQTAAKNGIGVSGDLNQDINISGIDVNLPIAEFKATIASTFKVLITDWMRKRGNGNTDVPGDNIDPNGASSWDTQAGSNLAGSIF
jgi:hypothetical protein